MGWLQLGVEVENQQGICDGSVHDIPTRQFDGLHWDRKDNDVGIKRSTQGWDCEMIEYGYVQQLHNATYLFYNGNGFGATGFGYAVRDK